MIFHSGYIFLQYRSGEGFFIIALAINYSLSVEKMSDSLTGLNYLVYFVAVTYICIYAFWCKDKMGVLWGHAGILMLFSLPCSLSSTLLSIHFQAPAGDFSCY